MTGPITLIRKKSQKLKRRLSRHDKSSDSLNHNNNQLQSQDTNYYSHHHLNRHSNLQNHHNKYLKHHNNLFNDDVYSPKNTVSFDLSPSTRPDFTFHTPIYSQGNYSYNNNNSRRSIDNLGTLIKVPKLSTSNSNNTSPTNKVFISSTPSTSTLNLNSPSPASTNYNTLNTTSNRKSFDLSIYQLNKSRNNYSKRVVSDSSLYSNSRPHSMILDNDLTFIPPHNIHNGLSTSSNLSSVNTIYPNRFSKSALSLSSPDYNNQYLQSNSSLIKGTPLNRSHSLNYNIYRQSRSVHTKTTSQPHLPKRHSHSSRTHNSNRNKHHKCKEEKVYQGINSKDLENWNTDNPMDVLFAVVFHILNIFFSVFVYLPIYLFIRLGYLSFILLALAISSWYIYGGTTSCLPASIDAKSAVNIIASTVLKGNVKNL